MADISPEALSDAIRLAETPLRVKPLIEFAKAALDRVEELEAEKPTRCTDCKGLLPDAHPQGNCPRRYDAGY